MFRVTAYVLRFVHNIKVHILKVVSKVESLNLDEVDKAETLWLKSCQKELVGKTKQLNNTLGLFIDDDNLIRCKGRLNLSNLPINQRNPILLPVNNILSELFIRQAHAKALHGGCKDTLTQLHNKYWILKGRSVVKQFLRTCILCNRLGSKPFKSRGSAQLPSYRIHAAFPFETTGVDYRGTLNSWCTMEIYHRSLSLVGRILGASCLNSEKVINESVIQKQHKL